MSEFCIDGVRDRLQDYLASQGLNNRSFERKCNLYNGFVKDIDSKITFESLAKIGGSCPNLNLGWLFSGLGRMLITEPDAGSASVNMENVQAVFITNWKDVREIVEDAVKATMKTARP